MMTDYERKFNTEIYLKDFYSNATNNTLTFVLPNLCQIYDCIRPQTGSKLLDFGCGPTIYGIAPAVKKFDEIYMAEFCSKNRTELQKWLKKEPGHFDWNPVLSYICQLQKISGNSN